MFKRENLAKKLYVFCCILFGLFFLFCLGKNGPIIHKDSGSFMNPSEILLRSYPLYPRIIVLCRTIFGETQYLHVVYFLQSLLAFVSSWALTEYIRKHFDLKYGLAFIVFVMSFLPYAYSLPEEVVNHHIMTEAVAYPLFTLYMMYVFKTFLEKQYRYMIPVGILTVLLILTRSQLMILALVYVLLCCIIGLQKVYKVIREKHRKWFWAGLLFSGVLILLTGILLINLFIERGLLRQLTDAVTGRVLCTIDLEDRELFSGEEEEVFVYLYKAVEEKQQRYPYFRDGLWKWEDIILSTNENTKMYFNTIKEYYIENGVETVDESARASVVSIVPKLFMHHLYDYGEMTLYLLLQSFVAAIFIHPTSIYALCHVLAVLIYLFAFVMLWYANRRVKIEMKYSIPLIITLIILAVVVIMTNILFYGMQRYVVYTFGCFYISCLCLGVGMFRCK